MRRYSNTNIGNVTIGSGAVLAPMAGVTDKTFRRLCREQGCAMCTTEMVSAKGLVMGDRKSDELIFLAPDDHPTAIQIFAPDPDTASACVGKVLAHSPDIIDINMGCPMPKIVRNGCGSALMSDPGLAGRIIAAVVRESTVPVTVKFRLGLNIDSINVVDFAKICEENGASAVTIHARTADQMYAPPTRPEYIAGAKRAVSVPVIANGDVFTPTDAAELLRITGCDAVAVARGALGNPWIFAAIDSVMKGEDPPSPPSAADKVGMMLRHARLICEDKGEYRGISEVRKHTAWYMKGMRSAAAFRARLTRIASLDELNDLCGEILEQYRSSETRGEA